MNENRLTEQGKKVIVIGGSGETGRRILQCLRQTYPTLDLTSANRNPQPCAVPDVAQVKLDLDDKAASVACLSQYDLAIIAVGPMNAFGSTPHELCLAVGIDSIDINDSLSAADAIFNLHEQAFEKGCAVYTGFGLAPGISTLMLMELAQQKRSASGRYCSRLYMGAAYGGGKSSPYSMLANFNKQITLFRDNKRLKIETPWKDEQRDFQFPWQTKPTPMIPYSTPEIAALAHERFDRDLTPVSSLDSRFHIQFFSPGLAQTIARINPGPKTINFLASKFYASGQSIKTRKNADPDTYLWVYPDDDPDAGIWLHGIISSYDLTAVMACAMFDCWHNAEIAERKGVFSVELLSAATRHLLTEALKKRGISWNDVNLEEQRLDNNYFGWLETNVGELNSLRNFGKNWYTVERHHPRMAELQKTFLLQSPLWLRLKQELNSLQLTGFVAKVMLRWRQHYKQLSDYRQHDKTWNVITRDLSMFTSGYSCLRDTIGQEDALKLYRDMFLATGDMEMRWLWPNPETFAHLVDPAEGVHQYWHTFMQGYQQLGLLTFTREELSERNYRYQIVDCKYAEVFNRLHCPELTNLVREMEEKALRTIARKSSLDIIWEHQPNGRSRIQLSSAQGE